LEIGAGCGALTGLFCERVKSVTAVELSKRRAEIIEARYKEYDNLEIIAGNFSEIDFNTQYNYITLIGVLEYAKKFVDDNNPISSFLSRISNLLKKDGKIIIAIENRFGLKYFAGAPEDHTGLLFNSIEGYNNNVGIETFGKNELINILTTNNFKDISFYYPYPDYKLPQTIYSDLFLPDFSEFLTNAINYDQKRYQLFNERLAFPNIINNQLFDIFSNSFLIFAEK